VKKEAVGEWKTAEPIVVMVPVSGSKRHGYVTMQNCEHKGQSKKYRPRKRDCLMDIEELTEEKIRPGENQQ
jgi:hypothetical protein